MDKQYLPKLEIKANLPTTITLINAEPLTGTGEFGPWYRYKVREGEIEKSFFANEYIHSLIQGKKPFDGMIITIIKKEKPGSKGFLYEILGENDESRPLAEARFVQDLDNQNMNQVQQEKETLITRMAIIKSLIESGRNKPTKDVFVDAKAFIEFCETGKVLTLDDLPKDDSPF